MIKKTPYELEREKNIAANNAILEKLGLPVQSREQGSVNGRTNVERERQKLTSTGVHSRKENRKFSKCNPHQSINTVILPTRRSSRLRQISSINPITYKEAFGEIPKRQSQPKHLHLDEGSFKKEKQCSQNSDDRISMKQEEIKNLLGKALIPESQTGSIEDRKSLFLPLSSSIHLKTEVEDSKVSNKINSNSIDTKTDISKLSSKDVYMDVEYLLRKYLGKYLPGATTKEFAMRIMAADSLNASAPKFSKYSGVTEWKNAIVLWVNIDGDDYKNHGIEGGSKLTWFGGSRHYHDSPVVIRMLSVHTNKDQRKLITSREECKISTSIEHLDEASFRQSEANLEDKFSPCKEYKDQILLLLRQKGGEYFFCGNVIQAGYDTTKHPIRIIWELTSHQAALSNNQDYKDLINLKL